MRVRAPVTGRYNRLVVRRADRQANLNMGAGMRPAAGVSAGPETDAGVDTRPAAGVRVGPGGGRG